MNKIPVIPENAPFQPEQRLWLNGFLAGYFSRMSLPESKPATTQSAKPGLLIVFGSQTGTAEALARRVARLASGRGFDVRVRDAAEHGKIDWRTERTLLVITSTYGDGEMPDNAKAFGDWLQTPGAAALVAHLHFSVLGLGDRNYPEFCAAGKKIDARLENLGACRFLDRVDCDVEYEAEAGAWIEGVLNGAQNLSGASGDLKNVAADGSACCPNNGTFRKSVVSPLSETLSGFVGNKPNFDKVSDKDPSEGLSSTLVRRLHLLPASGEPERNQSLLTSAATGFSKANPFPAPLLNNIFLNKPGSAKEVRHFELELQGSGLEYEVGDALGVVPCNCAALVDELLAALQATGEESVRVSDEELPLREALTSKLDITKPSSALLSGIALRAPGCELSGLLAPERAADLREWLWGRDIVDLLRLLPWPYAIAEFVAALRKLSPRLYSIASSPKAHAGQVHLTVNAVRYESHGRRRKGVASTYLADRVENRAGVKVFVQPSHGFRLPKNNDTPIIMAGPGTGIAPFRAFLEERQTCGARGKNWLFFGDQKRRCDFLYEDELTAWHSEGHLTRLDVAFSRDQVEKIYVQHLMLEKAAEVWAWLQDGAHFYVCGDASRMARDVDAALHQIAEQAGSLSSDAAKEFVKRLKTDKRYQRDVY